MPVFGDDEDVESSNLVPIPLGMAGSNLNDYQLTRDTEFKIRIDNPKYANSIEKCKDVTEFACLIAEVVKFPTPETFDDSMTRNWRSLKKFSQYVKMVFGN